MTTANPALQSTAGAWNSARDETGGRQPRRATGPVLMGDIHGQLNGTPMLLLLWARWEAEADERGE